MPPRLPLVGLTGECMRKNRRGNILFLVLLAVVLFAALSYAVTSSMRGEGRDASSERMALLASQLLQNASLVESTITRAQLMNNIPDWGFDFHRGPIGGTPSPNNSCTQPECRIFAENGGTVPLITVPPWAARNGINDAGRSPIFYAAQALDIGTSAPDLIMTYTDLTLEFCKALNVAARSDVALSPIDPINSTGSTYSGTLTAMPVSSGVIGDTNPTLKGKKAACYQVATGPIRYRFHYVLMER